MFVEFRRPCPKIIYVRIGDRRQQLLLGPEKIIDIAKRYRYNLSEALDEDTQNVLALILDTIERKLRNE